MGERACRNVSSHPDPLRRSCSVEMKRRSVEKNKEVSKEREIGQIKEVERMAELEIVNVCVWGRGSLNHRKERKEEARKKAVNKSESQEERKDLCIDFEIKSSTGRAEQKGERK